MDRTPISLRVSTQSRLTGAARERLEGYARGHSGAGWAQGSSVEPARKAPALSGLRVPATQTEMLKGAERSTRKAEVVRRLEALARQVPVRYPAGPGICRHYAEQAARLKDSGTPIGANDLWIACHALAEDATLVVHNIREFSRIGGLRIEDWAASAET